MDRWSPVCASWTRSRSALHVSHDVSSTGQITNLAAAVVDHRERHPGLALSAPRAEDLGIRGTRRDTAPPLRQSARCPAVDRAIVAGAIPEPGIVRWEHLRTTDAGYVGAPWADHRPKRRPVRDGARGRVDITANGPPSWLGEVPLLTRPRSRHTRGRAVTSSPDGAARSGRVPRGRRTHRSRIR